MDSNNLEPIGRLDKDLRLASKVLEDREARYLVDTYYQMQENRIRSETQVKTLNDEPHSMLVYLAESNRKLEDNIKVALDVYSHNHPMGRWMRANKGIGPVSSAGLLAHIDITRAPTAGHLWSFAGLNPTAKMEKGKKRPWNGRLKTLCWKIGEGFVKVSNYDDAYYGHIYKKRKEFETAQNAANMYAEQAADILKRYNFGKTTDAYKWYMQGKLPPAHIHSRAKRYAVKFFLSHLHEVWYKYEHNEPPPAPFAIRELGHTHYVPPRPDIEQPRKDQP